MTDFLIFAVVSTNPPLPPWFSQWPVTLPSGLEQRRNRSFLPKEVTPSSPTVSSHKQIYFSNYSGVGRSPSELPSFFGKRHHPLPSVPSTFRSWQLLPAISFPL